MDKKSNTSVLLFTVPEAASKIQVSNSLLYRYVHLGELPVVRFGRSVRIRPEDLENFIQKNLTRSMSH